MPATRDRLRRIGRRWRSIPSGRRMVLALVVATLGAWACWQGYRWWVVWPARIELRVDPGHHPVAFSPDGSKLLTRLDWGAGLFLWDVAGGKRLASWPAGVKGSRFGGAFSPDGRTFASPWFVRGSGKDFSVDLIDVETGRVRSTFDAPLGGYVGLRVLDGGRAIRLVAVGNPTGYGLVDVDLASGRVLADRRAIRSSPGEFLGQSSLSADGRFLALGGSAQPGPGGGPAVATVWDLDLDREAARLPAPGASGLPIVAAFSPDGKRLALGFDDGAVESWDLAGRRRDWAARDHSSGFSPGTLAYSPDGSTLASFAKFRRLTVSLGTVKAALAWAFRDRDHQEQHESIVLDAADGRRLIHAPNYGGVVYSPDGRALATGHDDGVVRIHDVPRRH